MKRQYGIRIIVSLVLLTAGTTGAYWNPVGSPLDGCRDHERFGKSLALSADGMRLAVGAPVQYNVPGCARVFEWDGTTWNKMGLDIIGQSMNDDFGFCVSLSADGNRLAVGAPSCEFSIPVLGFVRVYDWTGSEWVQAGSTIYGDHIRQLFGSGVFLSADGQRLGIGAPTQYGTSDQNGTTRIYDWNGSAWVQVGDDIIGAAHEFARISSMSADGCRVAIAVPGNDDSGTNAGCTRIYEWNGSSWDQIGSNIRGETEYDDAGKCHLSSDGNRIVVSAMNADSDELDVGSVRVFDWNGYTWEQQGSTIYGEAGRDRGECRALSPNGNRLIIASIYHKETGYIRVFDWDGADWIQTGEAIYGENVDDRCGGSVLSADGSRLAVASYNYSGSYPYGGRVRVFDGESPAPAAGGTRGTFFAGMPRTVRPGDTFKCSVTLANPGPKSYMDTPLFVVLECYGEYFCLPDFSAYSHYSVDLVPGSMTVHAVPAFVWPSGAGTGAAVFYAAMTDPDMTHLFGEASALSFEWME